MQLRARVPARQELQQGASVDFAYESTAWCPQCCLQYAVMLASWLLGQVAMHELCYGLFDSDILCSWYHFVQNCWGQSVSNHILGVNVIRHLQPGLGVCKSSASICYPVCI